MGRVCNGPRVLWAEFVMGRDVPEPSVGKMCNPHPHPRWKTRVGI